jgi:3(or 17)beta-hydroxysteroid dehydrogenase
MGRVDGKVALVTGAASGIGRACARRLAAEGARVIVADRNISDGEAVARELGAPHTFAALDVTDPAAWEHVVGALDRLDDLVNAAGVGIVGDIETATLHDWRFVNAVNSEACSSAARRRFA